MTKVETIHMGDVLAIWHKREDGKPCSRWELDDLWRCACSILSAKEAGAAQQYNVAEFHHTHARKFLEQHNAAVAEAAAVTEAQVADG